jgi:hypothetical protein
MVFGRQSNQDALIATIGGIRARGGGVIALACDDDALQH